MNYFIYIATHHFMTLSNFIFMYAIACSREKSVIEISLTGELFLSIIHRTAIPNHFSDYIFYHIGCNISDY